MTALSIRGLLKSYGSTPVLKGLDLTAADGEVTAVLGASGSGKTTLLRVIAGFERADAGSVCLGDDVLDDGHRAVRAQLRGVGFVPQDAALFPHLNVARNIGFGVPRSSRSEVGALVDLVGLTGLEHRLPHQLSGGQQQRVALARALAIKPRVVLLDEPFGSLDAALRESVRSEVIDVLKRAGTTTVLVTHDQDEALSLAHSIAILDSGRMLAQDEAHRLYSHPASPAVATAIGTANLLPGVGGGGTVSCALGTLASAVTGACTVMLRPEQLALSSDGPAGVKATVTRLRYHGHDIMIDVAAGALELTARVTSGESWTLGQTVFVAISGDPHIWPDTVSGV